MDKKLFILGIICISIVLVSGILIDTFSVNLTSENLTFFEDENITRNLTIPYNALVNGATINLSGYRSKNIGATGGSYCYQESTNTTNQTGIDGDCNLNYTGNYTFEGTMPNQGNMIDGNWNTYADSDGGFPYDALISVYIKPENAIYRSSFIYKITPSVRSVTIPLSCFDANEDYIMFKLWDIYYSSSLPPYHTAAFCMNNESEWQLLYGYASQQYAIFEEAMNWTISVPITNPYVQINNTNIWNHTGEFNSTFSPNKTSDFASTLNTALNDGQCDCNGCVLNETNCIIETLFHSDSAGILEYSAINITYTPAPFPTLESPSNNSYSPAIKIFNCSATDEEGLTNVTFYFWNSTGSLNLSTTIPLTGTSNSTVYEMTFNSTDTYKWGCSAFNNNSRNWWADDNFTINVNIDNPIINSLIPSNNFWITDTSSSSTFYYTPTHSTLSIDTCKFYTNFTGSWLVNQTDSSIDSDVQNNFSVNLSGINETNYKWTIWCNVSNGNSAFVQAGNYSLNIDTIKPISIINSITTTLDSKTFWFNHTTTDLNINTCKYSIYDATGAIDGANENVMFNCGTGRINATVTDYAAYTLKIYAIDKAGNENSTNSSFTTSESTTPTGGGGGVTVTTEDLGFCGDDICNETRGETFFNCPEDCSETFPSINLDNIIFNCFDDDESSECIWATNPGLFLVLGFMVFLLVFTILFEFKKEAKGIKKWTFRPKYKKYKKYKRR